MSDITNTADVIHIRDIIERVEELREQRTRQYVVGFNMPGYMPDSEPSIFDDADEARASLADEMRRSAETEEESAEELEEAADALELLSSDEAGAEWGRTIGQFHYWLSYEGRVGLDDDETEELETLEGLLDELSGCGGDEQWDGSWYPVTLIRDSYFRDYAQELAEECGFIPEGLRWPCTCIDWEQAAHEMRMDYSSVEYDGVTYWYR